MLKTYSMLDPILFRNQERNKKAVSVSYHVVDNFLDLEEIKLARRITSKYDRHLVDSRQWQTAENLEWFFIDSTFDREIADFDRIIVDRILSVNETIFKFDIDSFIRTKYLVYKEGHYSGWHADGPLAIEANDHVKSGEVINIT